MPPTNSATAPGGHQAGKRCFVARPISLRDEHRDKYRDGSSHWQHVQDLLITPAVKAAGYEVVEPESEGANLIHGDIIEHLNDCDLVLADFSTLNPNVLFEAGVRTSVNKALIIIAEKGTELPFDTKGINTWFYTADLDAWTLVDEVPALTRHVEATDVSGNALWQRFGVELQSAQLSGSTSPEDARLQLLTEEMRSLRQLVQEQQPAVPPSWAVPRGRWDEELVRLAQEYGWSLKPDSARRTVTIEAPYETVSDPKFVDQTAQLMATMKGVATQMPDVTITFNGIHLLPRDDGAFWSANLLADEIKNITPPF